MTLDFTLLQKLLFCCSCILFLLSCFILGLHFCHPAFKCVCILSVSLPTALNCISVGYTVMISAATYKRHLFDLCVILIPCCIIIICFYLSPLYLELFVCGYCIYYPQSLIFLHIVGAQHKCLLNE